MTKVYAIRKKGTSKIFLGEFFWRPSLKKKNVMKWGWSIERKRSFREVLFGFLFFDRRLPKR